MDFFETDRKHVVIALVSGLVITVVLTFTSALAVHFFPYKDLPLMPKPVFLYALAPGIIVGEWFEDGWASTCAFFITNMLGYAVAVFCNMRETQSAKR